MWHVISTETLEQYLDEGRDIVLIDMRDRESYRRGHIRGAVSLPFEGWQTYREHLPKDKLIVLYCYHGPNSMRAARRLAALGYQAADVYGGIRAYKGKYLI